MPTLRRQMQHHLVQQVTAYIRILRPPDADGNLLLIIGPKVFTLESLCCHSYYLVVIVTIELMLKHTFMVRAKDET